MLPGLMVLFSHVHGTEGRIISRLNLKRGWIALDNRDEFVSADVKRDLNKAVDIYQVTSLVYIYDVFAS